MQVILEFKARIFSKYDTLDKGGERVLNVLHVYFDSVLRFFRHFVVCLFVVLLCFYLLLRAEIIIPCLIYRLLKNKKCMREVDEYLFDVAHFRFLLRRCHMTFNVLILQHLATGPHLKDFYG